MADKVFIVGNTIQAVSLVNQRGLTNSVAVLALVREETTYAKRQTELNTICLGVGAEPNMENIIKNKVSFCEALGQTLVGVLMYDGVHRARVIKRTFDLIDVDLVDLGIKAAVWVENVFRLPTSHEQYPPRAIQLSINALNYKLTAGDRMWLTITQAKKPGDHARAICVRILNQDNQDNESGFFDGWSMGVDGWWPRHKITGVLVGQKYPPFPIDRYNYSSGIRGSNV